MCQNWYAVIGQTLAQLDEITCQPFPQFIEIVRASGAASKMLSKKLLHCDLMQRARVSGSYTCRVALPLAPVEERSPADEHIPSAGMGLSFSHCGRSLISICKRRIDRVLPVAPLTGGGTLQNALQNADRPPKKRQ
jgi:hypothetical protein